MDKTGVNNAISHHFQPAAQAPMALISGRSSVPMKSRLCSVPDEVPRGHVDQIARVL
jgi:hypothetical protein